MLNSLYRLSYLQRKIFSVVPEEELKVNTVLLGSQKFEIMKNFSVEIVFSYFQNVFYFLIVHNFQLSSSAFLHSQLLSHKWLENALSLFSTN